MCSRPISSRPPPQINKFPLLTVKRWTAGIFNHDLDSIRMATSYPFQTPQILVKVAVGIVLQTNAVAGLVDRLTEKVAIITISAEASDHLRRRHWFVTQRRWKDVGTFQTDMTFGSMAFV